mgnify:CR=1 FL=1
MAKIEQENLSNFGFTFQIKLLASILEDKKFANRIVEILDPNFFEDETLKIISATIKEAYETGDVNLDLKSLEARLLKDSTTTIKQGYIIQHLEKLKNADMNDIDFVQNEAIDFCKMKALMKTMAEINVLAKKGTKDYTMFESMIRTAIEKGAPKDEGTEVWEDIAEVLKPDSRKPIPTGIKGLDAAMDGGLSKGELALVVAAYGVGKTTVLTKIANSAKNAGCNVLQIFFEDTASSVKKKHYACWTGIKLNDLKLHPEEVTRVVNEKRGLPGKIKLMRFPSDGTTIPKIRQYIRKLIAKGFKPDLIVIDYIDCVQPSKKIDDPNVGEGAVMREFESMLFELDMAGWTATQGNRESIDAAIVGGKQMGGSIKKGQICHFVLTIAKDQDQQADGTATMAIIKSRFGKSGKIFDNAVFNNETIQIELDENNVGKSIRDHKGYIDTKEKKRVGYLLDAANAAKNRLNVLNTNGEEDNLTTNNEQTNNIEENNTEI